LAKRRRDVRSLGIDESSCLRGHSALYHKLRRLGTQHGATRPYYRPLYEILQFADISWPIMAFKSFYHVLRDLSDRLAMTVGELSNEVLYQEPNVISSFP
jgi:hypothetical protein